MNSPICHSPLEILIVGTGALGTLFAARLAEAGHRITMLGTWKAGVAALQKDGARVLAADGSIRRANIRATSDAHECVGAKYALLLVKAWQTERAAKQLTNCLTSDGIAVTLQNGLGNYEILVNALTAQRALLGNVIIGATLVAPGLTQAGGGGSVFMQEHPRIAPLEAALTSAHFDVHTVADARSLVWGKLIINAALNPLTALLRVTNGEMLTRPSARELMAQLACEAAKVARAEGITLPYADPVAAAEDAAHKTAANRSSMLQDTLRNAPTEIDAINGAIVSIARKHQIETPVNLMCWKLIRALTGA